MLEPLGKGLLGTTLRFDYEVRSEKEYFSHIPLPRISKDMVSLALHILETKAAKFDPGKFKDEYETALRKLVQRKAKGHTIEAPEPEEKPSNVINLMDALHESLKTNSKQARTSVRAERNVNPKAAGGRQLNQRSGKALPSLPWNPRQPNRSPSSRAIGRAVTRWQLRKRYRRRFSRGSSAFDGKCQPRFPRCGAQIRAPDPRRDRGGQNRSRSAHHR